MREYATLCRTGEFPQLFILEHQHLAMLSMSPNSLALSPSRQNLWRLIVIRMLVLLAQTLSVSAAYYSGLFIMDWTALVSALGCSMLVTVLTLLRLSRDWPVTNLEYAGQLFFDMLIHSVLLFYSGGPGNPFLSYYLVPLTIAAATLNWRYTLVLSSLSVILCTLVLLFYTPMQVFELVLFGEFGNLRVVGAWLNFVMGAALISLFVARMADALRQNAQRLAERREQSLRDAQLLGIASVAAGAAHEMSTPLSTMSVLLKDLRCDCSDPNIQEDLELLQEQVKLCRDTLQQMVRSAEISRSGSRHVEPVDNWLHELLERWQLMRPEVSWTLQPMQEDEAPLVMASPELGQSVLNLLNNAADACPDDLQVRLSWDAKQIRLNIRDHGPGVPLHIAEQIGSPFLTTKGKKGFGLGLFLSQAAVQRLGGSVKLYNQDGGGTLTEVLLPIAQEQQP
ncbi:two-component system, sensor histidine kinase RegB [Halopseudomonas yangmingensis]|uniref:histidine kinase n=2 Tax=Halopseudomonas yangmingensis TaxID=1720063 RepID=A0A1I4P545_9GAMM|nr:two-component system, sensor histidine kinase RegB [Halopseudomonas yangmingensis]